MQMREREKGTESPGDRLQLNSQREGLSLFLLARHSLANAARPLQGDNGSSKCHHPFSGGLVNRWT